MEKDSSLQLPRTLQLRDLVLFNLVAILGISWVATAAKAGPSSITLWLLAALFFFVPQGLAVTQLSSSYPDEGGIYSWTKRELGEGHGFVCGWCYWINNVLYYPSLVLAGAVTAPYVLGQENAAWTNSWVYVLPFAVITLGVAVLLNVIGTGTGKWLQNIGGLGVYLPGMLLLILGIASMTRSGSANAFHVSELRPHLTDLPQLNLWATIAFAFAGLELSSTMGQEIQDARRNLPRATFISAPLIAIIYIGGTLCMLWLVPRSEINVVAGPLQAITNGLPEGWHLAWVVSLAALLITISKVGGLGAWLTGSARVAFVVGLDHYFPAAFGRIHPRFKTPYVAILVQAVIALFFLLLSVLGKGTTVEKAFLMLIDMSLLIYFIPYCYLFLCFGRHCYRERHLTFATPGGRGSSLVAAIMGLAITVFAMIVAMVPPPETPSTWLFEAKVAGGSLLLILLGLIIYYRARRSKLFAPVS